MIYHSLTHFSVLSFPSLAVAWVYYSVQTAGHSLQTGPTYQGCCEKGRSSELQEITENAIGRGGIRDWARASKVCMIQCSLSTDSLLFWFTQWSWPCWSHHYSITHTWRRSCLLVSWNQTHNRWFSISLPDCLLHLDWRGCWSCVANHHVWVMERGRRGWES